MRIRVGVGIRFSLGEAIIVRLAGVVGVLDRSLRERIGTECDRREDFVEALVRL